MSITQAIRSLKEEMEREEIFPEKGLGTECFQFASTLMPVVNVDLLITNDKHEILLSWRNDSHCGTGWHIPGGCIRLMETAAERIQKTALAEIGVNVFAEPDPIKFYEIFSKIHREGIEDQRERAHFITLVYKCRIPKEYSIPEERSIPGKVGSLQWFGNLPDDLLQVQDCYRNDWKTIKEKLMED